MQQVREISHYCKKIYKKIGNRRKFERLPVEGIVTASWRNRYDELVTCQCICVNLSQKGIALVSEEPAHISADAYVHSSQYGLKSFAQVRYCRQSDGGYRIGLNFRAGPVVWK